MNDIVPVQIVYSTHNLFDGLGRILLCELALLANPVKQLSARRKFGDNVVLVLCRQYVSFRSHPRIVLATHS